MRKKWLFCGLPLLAAPAVVLGLLSAISRRPENLGAVDGRLADCPASPNCVATQSGRPGQRMPPWPFAASPQAALERLKQIVGAMPRAKIVSASENYLHAEFTSAVFRFVDDVEFLIDPDAKLIHFRSASRIGYSDLGANRRRMQELRRRWQSG